MWMAVIRISVQQHVTDREPDRNMDEGILQEQFAAYVERMRKVRLLSTPSLDDISVAEDYSRLLLSNFKKIGEYAGENRIMLDEILFPLLGKKGMLSGDEEKCLKELIRLLADGALTTEIDIHLSELISDFLSREEEKKLCIHSNGISGIENRIRLLGHRIDILYAQLYYCGRSDMKEWNRLLEESESNYEEAFSYLNRKIFEALPLEMRFELVMLAINGTSMYNTRPNSDSKENTELALKQKRWLERILDILNDPFYEKLLTAEDRKVAILYIHSYIAAFGLLMGLSLELYKEAYSCAIELEREWYECRDLYERDLFFLSIRELQLYTSFLSNDQQFDDYLIRAIDIYEKRNISDFTYKGLIPNLSMANALFLVLSGLWKKDPEGLDDKNKKILYDIPLNVIRYLHRAPKRENLGQYVNALSTMIEFFVELPGGINIQDFCIRSMAAMHPPTYIHSNMVAKISVCLCRHLISYKPDIFCGFPGCDTVGKVLDAESVILDYVEKAALLHDIGKLYVIDTIAMYGRRLLDSVFGLIRSHPEKVAELALRFDSMREYADVIRGHHRWFDGSRGYPEDFNASDSPYKMITDIVSVADSLDAATDGVGRSYRAGKTLDDFKRELAEGAGRRYAPYMPELFDDPSAHEDLVYLLENGRRELYEETYYLLKELLEKTRRTSELR